MSSARERYLSKGKRPRGRPRKQRPEPPQQPAKKTHVTATELVRLNEILAKARELRIQENALIDAAYQITGERDGCGWTLEAIVGVRHYDAADVARLCGLTVIN